MLHKLINYRQLLSMSYLLAVFGACHQPEGNLRRFREDRWLVTGRISNQDFFGGEVLALGLDGKRFRSRIGKGRSFGIELPGNSIYALYFINGQADRQAVVSAKESLEGDEEEPNTGSLLHFEESPDIGLRDSLRLPKIVLKSRLHLGDIDIKDGHAFATINPSTRLDFDFDGINDFTDRDDQNDGLSDDKQRKTLERLKICHFLGSKPSTKEIHLSQLLYHLNHGDSIGPCQYSQD